jgi:NAD(P)-binding Rossmann-like domain
MMASIKDALLPTLERLHATVADDLDVRATAQAWVNAFSQFAQTGDAEGLSNLFIDDAFWRDILALTWNFRTFYCKERIHKFLTDRLAQVNISSVQLDLTSAELQRPFPDVAWVQSFFKFETPVGYASGIVRLVPTSAGIWKAHSIFTNLEDLKGFPERLGALRVQDPNPENWREKRRKEIECEDEEPKVIIVGGGQSGLTVAARLKALGVKTLVIDENSRVGHMWRSRYESLCLHDTVCKLSHARSFRYDCLMAGQGYDHLPYLPCVSSCFRSMS